MHQPFNCGQKFNYVDWHQLLWGNLTEERKAGFDFFIKNWLLPLGFKELPASRYYHGCYPGGLVEHMARVTYIALQIRDNVFPEISRESVAICASLHDLNKFGVMTNKGPMPRYIKNVTYNPDLPVSKSNAPYSENPEVPILPSTHWITMVASSWLPVTLAEWKAISFHDGQYVPENIDIFKYHNAEPLLLLTAFADMMSLPYEGGNSFTKNVDLKVLRPEDIK